MSSQKVWMLLKECDMRNFKPVRRILIIACVIYQMLFSMTGGMIVYGSCRRLITEREPSFFVSCLDLILSVFVLCFPMVCGFIVLMAFDGRRKQPPSERNVSKRGEEGNQQC